MLVRVIGVGQRAGGDDGAGPAVLDILRTKNLEAELFEVAEPSALLPLLEVFARVVIVDAALTAGEPGRVLVLRPEDIEAEALSSLSTHGMSVGQAIALARVLEPENVSPDIRLVAITAERPKGIQIGLSEKVKAALSTAADVVRALICKMEGEECTSRP